MYVDIRSAHPSFHSWKDADVISGKAGRHKKSGPLMLLLCVFFFFILFRATHTAYGGSQARGLIRAVAAGLHHCHSNARSKPCLQPTPQLRQRWILDPLSEARDQTCNLMVTSWMHFRCTTAETPQPLPLG